jgi:catechol 2,3-dioxygenase-like lactoylglutathione lyase family enzyme/uncharacterized protein YndB with AHSA1/START domain
MSNDQITHQVVVDAGRSGAFDAFTAHLGAWWPLAYTFSEASFADAAIEPGVGGVWFERNASGEKLPWGEVRACQPGERLVLAFAIGPDRKPASNDAASEVEVRFSADGPGRTRVEVQHRAFARHGDGGERLRAGMNSAQGWPLILAELRRWIQGRPAVRYIVSHMDAAIAFYADQLGFVIEMRPAPGFAALSRGSLRLYLNEPGAGGAGAIAGGRHPAPGGWNRLQLIVADLTAEVDRLRGANCTFRGNLIEGNGGRQILLEDPSGNPIELLEPRRRISS